MTLKRDVTKYVRDRAKNGYDKGSSCEICGSTEKLDFHHFYSVSLLIKNWMSETGNLGKDVLDWRDQFIEEHRKELYDDTVTLCHDHHLKLHSIYGSFPSLGTAKKQQRWVIKQREKHGLV